MNWFTKHSERWEDANGKVSFELFKSAPGVWQHEFIKKPVDPTVAQVLDSLMVEPNWEDHYANVVIHYTSSGFYEPGQMYNSYGDPGEPPDGSEEKTVVGVTVNDAPVSPEIQQIFEQAYESEIDSDDSYAY